MEEKTHDNVKITKYEKVKTAKSVGKSAKRTNMSTFVGSFIVSRSESLISRIFFLHFDCFHADFTRIIISSYIKK